MWKCISDFVRKADGVNLISQTVDKNKWKVAADAAKAVINLAESGVYELHTVPRSAETLPLPETLADVKNYPEGPGGIDAFKSYRELFCGNDKDKWVTKEVIWAKPPDEVANLRQPVRVSYHHKKVFRSVSIQSLVQEY